MSGSSGSIGVFDSGVGGLTVARALVERLDRESLIYLGDTARVPYGSKSAETVARYSELAARFLLSRDVKLIVIACNTASAFAMDALKASLKVPVIGVIEPGAKRAVEATRGGHIGVIGTLGTVRSGAYARAIAKLDGSLTVTAHACPILVPLAEEGWVDAHDPITEAAVRRYLTELRARDPEIDVLVLGCTHYPLLKDTIANVSRELFARELALVDSAETMASAVSDELSRRGLATASAAGTMQCCVTDEARIAEVGARFFGRSLGEIERVDL